jgi:hypothetical protein
LGRGKGVPEKENEGDAPGWDCTWRAGEETRTARTGVGLGGDGRFGWASGSDGGTPESAADFSRCSAQVLRVRER